MKKLLLGLGAATAAIVPIAAVVACGQNSGTVFNGEISHVSNVYKPVKLEFQHDCHDLFTVSGMLSGRALPADGQTIILVVETETLSYTWKASDTSGIVPKGFLAKTKTQVDMLRYLAQKLSGQTSGAKYNSAIKVFQNIAHHDADTLT